jgi:hypothetical protein
MESDPGCRFVQVRDDAVDGVVFRRHGHIDRAHSAPSAAVSRGTRLAAGVLPTGVARQLTPVGLWPASGHHGPEEVAVHALACDAQARRPAKRFVVPGCLADDSGAVFDAP